MTNQIQKLSNMCCAFLFFFSLLFFFSFLFYDVCVLVFQKISCTVDRRCVPTTCQEQNDQYHVPVQLQLDSLPHLGIERTTDSVSISCRHLTDLFPFLWTPFPHFPLVLVPFVLLLAHAHATKMLTTQMCHHLTYCYTHSTSTP